ncbi:MAG: hypothetical protein ACI4NP_01735 [Thermoguttaceae bacterium]
MTCSDERSSDKRDWNDLFARLDGIVSYLRSIEDLPGSDYTLDQELYNATSIFLTLDNSPDGRALRESKWPLIRRCLRKIDGYISDKEVFEAYARRSFDRDWLQATPEKRRELVNAWLFDKKPMLKSDRLANFAINMAQVISTDKRGDAKLNELIDYIVSEDSREIAFQLSEYISALDDYSFSESSEVETLCNRLIDFVYDCYQAIRKRDEKKRLLEAKASKNAEKSKSMVEGTPVKTSPKTTEDQGTQASSALEDADSNSKDSKANEERVIERDPQSGFYLIDERLARQAQESNSFREYVPNTATREYRASVNTARATAARQKEKVGSEYHEAIDLLLEEYERQLAIWYDNYHKNAASCPSARLVGPKAVPREKHAAKVKRASELFREHEKIDDLAHEIGKVGIGVAAKTIPHNLTQTEPVPAPTQKTSSKPPTSPTTMEESNDFSKLQARLIELKEKHAAMKEANSYRRKHGSWDGYDGVLKDVIPQDPNALSNYFDLSSSLAEIKRVERRLGFLTQIKPTDEDNSWPFEGGRAKLNYELNRLQIIFESKPDDEIRMKLRECGFRWSPRNKAWQRLITPDSIFVAKRLGFIPNEWTGGDTK